MPTAFNDVHTIPLIRVKAFLLTCGDSLALVDTGRSEEDAETILEYVKSLNKSPRDVEICLITHRHRDHIGGLSRLKKECGFKVASHREDAQAIEEITSVPVDITLDDGQMLPYCEGIKVVHIPGHTPGNICLFLMTKGTMIAGDTLFVLDGELSPPPDRYCEDPAMAKRGLRKLLKLDFDALLVSHGDDILENGRAELKRLLGKLGY